MNLFTDFLGIVMKFLYDIVGNYGVAIILFTLFSKIILLPISILVQKNSIKMVKMQPAINRIHIQHFGDKDTIADEETALYKAEKYRPLLSIIPLVIQIVLLLGLVEVINHPDIYIRATHLDQNFLGFDLTWVAAEVGGLAIWVPILAGLSALILCIGQNKLNVLQKEQSFWNRYGMLILSVGLSLYLGTFVAAGVALYWVASNLFAVLLQWLLNIIINPKKFIDYQTLHSTGKELESLKKAAKAKSKRTPAQLKKEKQDYKRFFGIANKHLVFYSEGSGFYKYYQGIIEYLLAHTNLTIHYITSDYKDQVFVLAKEHPKLQPYYIEERKLITLMLKMDADVVVMTMPDLDRFHIKRSIVKKDINYVYIPHGMDSMNLTMRYKSTDAYNAVLVANRYQKEEMQKTNKLHGLKDRKIIECGYPLLDEMLAGYAKTNKTKSGKSKSRKTTPPTILIAPSWQKDNIIDLCLEDILEQLKGSKYHIIVRPHPQQVRHMREKFDELKRRYAKHQNIEIQTDFSSTDTVWNADLLLTDWSGIAYEYAFTTKRPVLFIDTPMKVMNPEYKELKIEPFNIWVREQVGQVLKVKDIKKIDQTITDLLKNSKKYQKNIEQILGEAYHIGSSSQFGAEYLIAAIKKSIKERKN